MTDPTCTGGTTVPTLLLCDVDGVLNPHRGLPGTAVRQRYRSATVPDDVAALTAEIAPWVQWCWATAWEQDANELLAPVLGLPPGPVVPMTCSGRSSWKLHAVASFVERYAPDRAVVWVDDHIGHRALHWAAQRRAPTQVVPVHGATGLRREHADAVIDFALRHRDVGTATVPEHPAAPGFVGVRRALFLAVRGASRWKDPDWRRRATVSGRTTGPDPVP